MTLGPRDGFGAEGCRSVLRVLTVGAMHASPVQIRIIGASKPFRSPFNPVVANQRRDRVFYFRMEEKEAK